MEQAWSKQHLAIDLVEDINDHAMIVLIRGVFWVCRFVFGVQSPSLSALLSFWQCALFGGIFVSVRGLGVLHRTPCTRAIRTEKNKKGNMYMFLHMKRDVTDAHYE